MKDIELWQGDCLELMSNIPDKSVDMIFADLPYSTTQCSWDCAIDLDKLWKQYKRIIKKNGCIALWAQAPFSHVLAMSNLSQYRYEWIIEKTKATGHLNAKKMPMKAHENVMVFADLDDSPETLQIFYGKLPTYNPQMTEGHTPVHSYTSQEFEMASSSPDAIRKFKKGERAIQKIEEAEAEYAEVKAPSSVCNLVYSSLISLPEFALADSHREYLRIVRKMSDEEIREGMFFTYQHSFDIRRLLEIIKGKDGNFKPEQLYGVPGFFFEGVTDTKGVWHFKKPMPNCVGIPLKNAKGEIVALQMRNMEKNSNYKYFYISSIYESKKNPKYGFGSSPSTPVAVCYPDVLKIPTFYIGEGIFKMKEVAKEGAVCFSVQGVNSLSYVSDEIKTCMKGDIIKSLPTSLSGQNEVKLVIVFDADMYTNIQVLEACLRASYKLSKDFPKKPISFLLWNPALGKGFDDMKFYCVEKGIDYRKKVRVLSNEDFTNIVKAGIMEADANYIGRHPEVTEDVAIRKTQEYKELLYKSLYLKRISNLIP